MYQSKQQIVLMSIIVLLLVTVGLLSGILIGGSREYRTNFDIITQLIELNELEKAEELLRAILVQNPNNRRAQRILSEIEITQQLHANNNQLSALASVTDDGDNDTSVIRDGANQDAIDSGSSNEFVPTASYTVPDTNEELSNADQSKIKNILSAIERGDSLLEDKSYLQARQSYEKVLPIQLADKEKTAEYHSLAMSKIAETLLEEYKQTGNSTLLDNATTLLNEAVALNPKNWPAAVNLAEAQSTNGYFADAINTLEKALLSNPNNPDLLFLLGNSYYRVGSYGDAISTYNKLIAIDSSYPKVYHNLGASYLMNNNPSLALAAFNDGLARDANNHRLLFRVGNIYYSEGQFQRSLAYFQKATQLNASDVYFARLGNTYFELNRYDEAYDSFKTAQKLNNNNEYKYSIALNLHKLGKHGDAQQEIESLLTVDSSNERNYYLYGEILFESGKIENAIRALNTAIQIEPDYAEAFSVLGSIYVASGNLQQGVENLQKSLSIDSTSAETNNRLGTAFLKQSNYQGAARYFNVAKELDPSKEEYSYNLALVHSDIGEYEVAQALLNDIISQNNRYWRAYEKLGEILIALGDKSSAQEVLEQLLQNNPLYPDRIAVENLLAKL